MIDWHPIWLSIQLATATTLVLLIVGVPIAYWLAYTRVRWKAPIEAIISLPLVLPPTVIGFYLLLVFSPTSALGGWLHETLGLRLIFSFPGLVLASVIYSLPFMVQPLQAGLSSLPASLHEAAYLLGKTRWQTLRFVLLPNIKPALLTATVLSFAHTIGEFGVVLMIGGNIPGQTRVAAIAVYDEVEALNYTAASKYSLVLLVLCFSILLTVFLLNGRWRQKRRQ